MSDKIPTLSLFSGAGGLDLGFTQAGFEIKACVEIEDSYCTTLRTNFADGNHSSAAKIHCEDIRSFDAKLYRHVGIRCVIGGPPCQTFSAAGRRAGGVIGTEDERGQLFRAYCRILDQLRPEVFVFENVYGLPGANGGRPWAEIVSSFSKLGYVLNAEVIDAADYGVPQHRERLIMVGHRAGSEYIFPAPTHGPDSPSGRGLVSVEEAISDLQPPKEIYHDDLGGLYGHLLQLVPEGLNYAYFTAEMGHPEPVFAWRSKFHDLLYKVSRSEPCRTIKAQPGKFTGPFHWKNRHFTIAELKRLQTFPDDYSLIGTYGKVLEQIGNSVPPRLAYVIASSVRDQLLLRATPEFAPRWPGFQSTFRQRQRQKSKQFGKIAQEAIEARYRKRGVNKPARARFPAETYYLAPKGLFDRTRVRSRIGSKYEVTLSEKGPHIGLVFDSLLSPRNNRFRVEISGLRKYLPDFDSLAAEGTAHDLNDVFHLWSVVEETLVKRSRFFSLIDIYGHYANRGDTVKVTGSWKLEQPEHMNRTLNWITSSTNCGDFISCSEFTGAVGSREAWLPKVVQALRQTRFDFRTSETHPIIRKGRVICTYPFPLLSPRALVESRAILTVDAPLDKAG